MLSGDMDPVGYYGKGVQKYSNSIKRLVLKIT